MLLLNIDSIGNPIWSKTYTPNGFGGGIAASILQMDNGDMVLLGGSGGYLTDAHPYLFKININGDTLWSKFYKCNSPQYSYGSISLAEELFNQDILFVTSYETNSDSVLLNNWYFNPSVISLVDGDGVQKWSNYYFTIDSAALKMTSSLVLEDSTVILSGYTMGLDVGAISHPFILKLNSDGTIIWDNILDTEAYSNGNYEDGLYEKPNGNIIWSTNHSGYSLCELTTNGDTVACYGYINTSIGTGQVQGFEQIGSTLFTSHFRIGKYDEDFICREFISFEENWRETEVTRSVDNELIGLSISYRGNRNIIVMQLDTADLSSSCSLQDIIPQYTEQNFHPILGSGIISRPIFMCESLYGSIYIEDVTSQIENHDSCSAENFFNNIVGVNTCNGLNVYPNPASTALKIDNINLERLVIYNLMGKREEVFILENSVGVTHLPNGIYFLQVGEETQKFVISR